MKTKFLFFILFMVSAFSLRGQFIAFENYEYFPVFLPKSDVEYLQNGKLLNDSIFFAEEKIKNIIIAELDSIPESITIILSERKSAKANFYYLGFINISSNYETYIFMIDYNWLPRLINRVFYMMNIDRTRLLSTIKIASIESDGLSKDYSFTKFLSPDILVSEYIARSLDLIDEHGRDANVEWSKRYTYKIDEQGYIDFK